MRNSHYFNAYGLSGKLLLLVIFCFGLACDRENKAERDFPQTNRVRVAESAININIASADELEKLPNIGRQTAQEIIRHREKFGRFRKPEHLLLIRGISDERFRAMSGFVRVE